MNPQQFFAFIFLWNLSTISARITLERPNDNPYHWDGGCVYRRVDIIHEEGNGNNCSLCTLKGEREAVFKIPTKEKYRNCTQECRKATICTVYTYKLDDKERPECFQCEPWEDEQIYFKFKRGYDICSKDCLECARNVDLATASLCAFTCRGKPTFCYPPRSWFGNEVCFQSNYTYGCQYKDKLDLRTVRVVDLRNGELAGCLKCVRTAGFAYRHLCALDCNGRASYMADPVKEGPFVYQCSLDIYQDVFDHAIPPAIRAYIRTDYHPLAAKNLTVHPAF